MLNEEEASFPNMRRRSLLVFFLASLAFPDQSEGNAECTRANFMCKPDECIFESWVCDSHQDCTNNKDEQSCGGSLCQIHHFGCSNGTCISNTQVCDQKKDCSDGEDESSCGSKCFSVEYTCANGECHSGQTVRCDGKTDCADGSDEMGCDTAQKCPKEDFVCSNGTCLKSDWVCDGEKDCTDGGDEVNCHLPPTCSSQEVTCPDGSCQTGYLNCMWGSSTTSLNSTKPKDAVQQCKLSQGCVVKVIGLVFGTLSLLTLVLGVSLYWRYRQNAHAGESQYLPLGRQHGPSSSSEAFTMDNVT